MKQKALEALDIICERLGGYQTAKDTLRTYIQSTSEGGWRDIPDDKILKGNFLFRYNNDTPFVGAFKDGGHARPVGQCDTCGDVCKTEFVTQYAIIPQPPMGEE